MPRRNPAGEMGLEADKQALGVECSGNRYDEGDVVSRCRPRLASEIDGAGCEGGIAIRGSMRCSQPSRLPHSRGAT